MSQSEQSKCHFIIKIIMLDKILESGHVKHPTKVHLPSGVGERQPIIQPKFSETA